MQLKSAITTAILAFSTQMIYVVGGSGRYGYPCSSSDGCQGILTCTSSHLFGDYRCLCPGFLVLDVENKACRTALGKLCEKDSDCVYNAECTMKRREYTLTCQCIKGMIANAAGNGCLPKTTFENVMTFFADIGMFWTFVVSLIVGGIIGTLIRICCRGKK